MISRKFKTVFVHIPKTAGQSIESVFLEAHGLTWETRAELLLYPNNDPAKGPERLAHLYAQEYLSYGYLTENEFRDFFKFSIVRNPYSRIVSAFNFRPHDFKQIREFVESARDDNRNDFRRHVTPQVKFLTNDVNGTIVVDNIIRYEDLSRDIPRLFRNIFGKNIDLPHKNAAKQIKISVESLSGSDINFINEFYKEDFETLAYPLL